MFCQQTATKQELKLSLRTVIVIAENKGTFMHIYTCYFIWQVGIAGVPDDVKMEKTKTKEDNWTPVWGEEFTFPLTVPEIALLRIEVHEYDMSEKDDFAGQTCFPVSEVRPGIRAVPLFDRKGKKLNSSRLLMHFEFV